MTAIRKTLPAYGASFLAGWHQAFINRAESLTSLLMYIVLLLIFDRVFAMMPIEELGVPGLTSQHLFWYFAITESITVSSPGLALFGSRIAQGSLTEMMQRPVHIMPMFVLRQTGEHMGYAMFFLAFAFITLPLFFDAPLMIQGQYIPFLLLSIFMGVVMVELLGYMFGATEVFGPYSRPMSWVVSKFIFAFGGLFFPVSFFPSLVRDIVLLTPFPSIIGVPGEFMLMTDAAKAANGLLMQVFWVIVLSGIAVWVERRMLRHVMEHGD